MTDPTSWRLSPSALPPEPRLTHVEFVMGTAVTFDLRFDNEQQRESAVAGVGEACEWLHWVDTTFTTYDESSYVRRLARGELSVDDCPPRVGEVIEMCERYRDETDGWFDPWAGPAGFDPSGLVKGWSVQLASDLLLSRGFSRHCVNGGGDVAARGRPGDAPAWGIGIVDPFDNQALSVVVRVVDEAVATSGVAERGRHVWRRDGTPATELASVTVLDPALTRADVYATTALAMGQEALPWLAARVSDAYVVGADRVELMTPGFADRSERFS
jgi:thiamine biosynthesis lipoprotein